MVKPVTKYEADDGTIHDSVEECEQHNIILSIIHVLQVDSIFSNPARLVTPKIMAEYLCDNSMTSGEAIYTALHKLYGKHQEEQLILEVLGDLLNSSDKASAFVGWAGSFPDIQENLGKALEAGKDLFHKLGLSDRLKQ